MWMYKGTLWWFLFCRYDPCIDMNVWSFRIGYDPLLPDVDGEMVSFTYYLSITWWPLAECFHWWVDYIWQRREGYDVQYRIVGFKHLPVMVEWELN